jgi:deoxyribonuclease-4
MEPSGPPLRLGAHLSVAGGTWRAVERAVGLECTAVQIFTQAPGRWSGRAIPDAEAERFRADAAAAGLDRSVWAHAPYLANPASGDRELRERSLTMVADQLERARRLGLAGVVLHPGAHTGDGVEVGLDRAAEGLAGVLDGAHGWPPLLLEVTAGQGTCLGADFRQIGALLERLPAGRAGVCWDTAHLWGAGYEVATEAGWERVWRDFRDATGRERPDLVHLNDTEVELGSRRDRHQRIGHGRIGEAGFARVVRDPRLAGVPMVLETPKGPDEQSWDRQALELLRGLAAGAAA